MKNKLEILIIVGDVNQFVADYGSGELVLCDAWSLSLWNLQTQK